MSTIVALSGYARAGKDTVADRLVEAHGYRKFAHADVLRESLFELDPFLDGHTHLSQVPGTWLELAENLLHGGEIRRLVGAFVTDVMGVTLDLEPVTTDHALDLMRVLNPRVDGSISLRELVTEVGWDEAKTDRVHGPEVRRLLQRLGSEVINQHLGADILGRELLARIAESFATDGVGPVVVGDVRRDDEAHVLLGRGATLWRVDRPGTGPANGHVTEAGIDEALVADVLVNDSTIAALHTRVDDLAVSLRRLSAAA
ncbi:hypothetical protein [Isoptericola croceus]|uniref:deoxynucleotide monophosphate kinase family protein n=1 Tax=Isoptericola croceus TaxID=3031406 RepID=UPI0023F8A722|nr:hypothetical protein [Isoptericola croceus]